jgi:2-polyprenyl-6-methoxyphenol hydroxylase-like FAD-dependent oxidoreductase
MVPGVRGALNLGHPRICDTLNAAAQAAGAIILRGVDKIQVYPGRQPSVEFIHQGTARSLMPRLIVGADGRGSSVARQVGFELQVDPVHHIFTGLLVDQVDAWATDEQSIGVDGDVGFYVLPQGGGKLRLYIAHGLDQKTRFAGVGSSDRLIAAMNRSSLPCGEALSRARAIGPCRGYPNSNTWIDNPVAPGVVLIGDAAGYSDPTGGQGISTALNDVKLVTQALNEAKDWTPEALRSYIEHRHERTRRIRVSTRLLARYRMEFTAEARQRRAKGRERMTANSELALPFLAMQKGPFAVPETAYSQDTWDHLIG